MAAALICAHEPKPQHKSAPFSIIFAGFLQAPKYQMMPDVTQSHFPDTAYKGLCASIRRYADSHIIIRGKA